MRCTEALGVHLGLVEALRQLKPEWTALELAHRGSTVDLTAFPADELEDAWSAEDALVRFLESGAPADRITVSSDGGGCLPVFNEQGEITQMDIGRPAMLAATLKKLLDIDQALERVLPAFTSSVANILRLRDKGRIRQGFAADFVVLDDNHQINDVIVAGIWHVKDKQQQVFGQFEKADKTS